MPQLEPLADQQIIKVCNLRHCCQQAEDALTQGMDKLQQTLAQSILNMNTGAGNYTSQMVSSMENLEALESFVNQVCLTFAVVLYLNEFNGHSILSKIEYKECNPERNHAYVQLVYMVLQLQLKIC